MCAHVLIPAFTNAEWGGIHEFVVDSAKTIRASGNSVTVVAKPGRFGDACREVGAQVIEVDWSLSAEELLEIVLANLTELPDLIFAQPQKSRELGLILSERLSIHLYSVFHGFYSDFASEWHPFARRIAVVSGVLRDFLAGFSHVPTWKIEVVPNSCDEELFDNQIEPFSAKVERTGVGTITLATRLDIDKVQQIDAIEMILPVFRRLSASTWRVRILGDGPERKTFEEKINSLTKHLENVEVEFKGWVSPEEVRKSIVDSVLTIGAGRFAIQSIALGTPNFAVGKHSMLGPMYGEALDIGIWSNFGDYPARGFETNYLRLQEQTDLLFSDDAFFREVTHQSRKRARAVYHPDNVGMQLLRFLDLK